MPRIDPTQLLKTLSVLLAPSGGIKSTDEVSRLVQLMQKFSKKLVSKVIYVNILKASTPELLEKFLSEKGWALLNFWFADAIKSSNWPLCAELTQLFSHCPMSAQRLKENVDQNLAPKLIRQLSCDARVDSSVRQLANQVLNKWMAVVQPPPDPEMMRTTRGTRSSSNVNMGSSTQSLLPSPRGQVTTKVPVIVHTSTDQIVNLDNMTTTTVFSGPTTVTTEGHHWVGKGRSSRGVARGGMVARSSRNIIPSNRKVLSNAPPKPGRSKELIDTDDDSDEENKPSTDPFDALRNSDKAKPMRPLVGVIRNESLDTVDDLLDGNSDNERPVKLLQGVANELTETLRKEVVDTIKDPKKVTEKVKDSSDSKVRDITEKVKDKKEREERREKERHKDKYKDKHREKDRDKEREKRKEEERRRREKERDREREKERDRQKDKERREKKRESKPYRETEMRDGLDSSEKQRIKELAQRMREENLGGKKEDNKSVPLSAGLGRIPKIPKKEETKKEEKKEEPKVVKKNVPSFEDLMFAMDSNPKTMKAPPIKNKNKDLLASINGSTSDKPSSKLNKENKSKYLPKKEPRNDFLAQFKTEDKSSKIIKHIEEKKPIATLIDKPSETKKEEKESKPVESIKEESKIEGNQKEEIKKDLSKKDESRKEEIKTSEKSIENKDQKDKKGIKRPSTEGESKIKLKPASQLVESSIFGDFLGTIMKDQPKKKKIKLSDLRSQKEAKAASENIMKSDSSDEEKENGGENTTSAPVFSFYRDTMEEEDTFKKGDEEEMTEQSETAIKPSDNESVGEKGEKSPKSPKSPKSGDESADIDMPFAEPKSPLPREVRGILVYAKGPKRTRRIKWRPDESLVEVEFFELDETERVNVNKLKFEEQRKKEFEFEKNAHAKQLKEAIIDSQPWKPLDALDCELPEIDYGGNSNEKKEQEQRENTVLQALFFNNKLPNDPLEPDVAGVGKGETKAIPLEDMSGEEEFKDYSMEGWPAPVDDVKDTTPPSMDVLNSLQNPNLLQNIIGGAMGGNPLPETGNAIMDDALYAAQKAAQETLRAQGLLPPLEEEEPEPQMNQSPPHPAGGPPGFGNENNFNPQQFPGHPGDVGFFPGPPMNGTWSGGPQHPGMPFRGGPPHRGGPPPNQDFNRGGFRPGAPMRGFGHGNGHHNGGGFNNGRGGFVDRFNNRGMGGGGEDRRRQEQQGNKKDFRRPCRFWMEKGFCREEGRCKFPHPPR